MSHAVRFSWRCRGCGVLCRSPLPGDAYAHLCQHCDPRTPSERVQLRRDYMSRTSGQEGAP